MSNLQAYGSILLQCWLAVIVSMGRVDTGSPYEYLHWSQAERFSNFLSFSKIQNLHDQVLNLDPVAIGFWVPQASHMGATDCRGPIFFF